MGSILKVKIFRYDPETDTTPRYNIFHVPEIKNMAVLDVVFHIQNNQDRSLAFRPPVESECAAPVPCL